jgi:pimeloyl-ACP methyl ester carboxylesterase
MLLVGGDSPAFSHEAVKLVHSSLPNSRIVVLDGQQHIAHHTNPDLLTQKLSEFLIE